MRFKSQDPRMQRLLDRLEGASGYDVRKGGMHVHEEDCRLLCELIDRLAMGDKTEQREWPGLWGWWDVAS